MSMARYELVQYSCDCCGKLSDIIEPDSDQDPPKGWLKISINLSYCDKCAKHIKE